MGFPQAVLTDFGGVLTSSVGEAIRAWSTDVSGDPEFLHRLLREDDEANRLFVDHECGRVSEAEFESGMAVRMRGRGVDPAGTPVAAGIQSLLTPDEKMLGALARVRARGVPVAIVSNALGEDCYRGYDLPALADVVVTSREVGMRKPSRGIFTLACDRLGIDPVDTVLIDDLQLNLDGAARLGIRGVLHTPQAFTAALLDDWFAPVAG